jgi:FkbM family methyltransferase
MARWANGSKRMHRLEPERRLGLATEVLETAEPVTWDQLGRSLCLAKTKIDIGNKVPEMHRFPRLARPLARAAGRAILYLSRVYSNRQSEFNRSLVDTVEALSQRVKQLETSHGHHQSSFPVFRPGSMDAEIWQHVAGLNEYNLPDSFSPYDTVIDIGGHIGSFSYAALARGAGQVHIYEANAANFEIILCNLRQFAGRVAFNRCAVWRSDRATDHLYFQPDSAGNGRRTGGGSVIYPKGEAVPCVAFDDVLQRAATGGRRIRLVKIDCEGSEWPILFTSRRLDLVQAMCGEYHELADAEVPEQTKVKGYPHYNAETLEKFLTAQGFTVRLQTTIPDVLGLFWAERG